MCPGAGIVADADMFIVARRLAILEPEQAACDGIGYHPHLFRHAAQSISKEFRGRCDEVGEHRELTVVEHAGPI